MTNKEAVNWLINLTADIGKSEHRDLWHYEQALSEIKEMFEGKDTDVPSNDTISRQDVIELVKNSYYNLAESMEDTWAMVADVERLPSAQSVDKAYLCDWYINSVTESEPVWTEAHISELMGDFYIIPKRGEQDGNT